MPKPEKIDDMRESVFFAPRDNVDIPDCSKHNVSKSQRLKLNIEQEIWVSQEEYKLHYCPDCLIENMDQRSNEDIYKEEQATHVFLLMMMDGGENESELKKFMNNLGEGEALEHGVRLVDNPPLEKIPEWVLDEGLYFVESDDVQPIDESYREEFIERFGHPPETVSNKDHRDSQ